MSGIHYARVPLEVLTSDACRTLPNSTFRVLIAIAAQYRGNNGGDLAMTWRLARKFGINSKKQLVDSLAMLLDRGLIEKTRQGGKKPLGPTLYNVTWTKIDDLGGKIESGPTTIASNSWAKWRPSPLGDQSAINHQHHRETRPAPQVGHIIAISAPQEGQAMPAIGTTGSSPSRVWSEGTTDGMSTVSVSLAAVAVNPGCRTGNEAFTVESQSPKPYTQRKRALGPRLTKEERLDLAMRQLAADPAFPIDKLAEIYKVTTGDVSERRKLN